MTIGVAIMLVWFAVVAWYLLRQSLSGALAVDVNEPLWEPETAAPAGAASEPEAPAAVVAFPLRRRPPLAAS